MYVVIDNSDIHTEILKCPSKCVFDWKLFFDLIDSTCVGETRNNLVGDYFKVNNHTLPLTNDEISYLMLFRCGIIPCLWVSVGVKRAADVTL
jgi:hypothetical protein